MYIRFVKIPLDDLQPKNVQPEDVYVRRKKTGGTAVGQGKMPLPDNPEQPAPTPDPTNPCDAYEIKAPWSQMLYFEMADDYWWHDPFIQIFSGGNLKRRKRYYRWRVEGWVYRMYYPCNPNMTNLSPLRYETTSVSFFDIWDDSLPGNEGVAAGSGGGPVSIGIQIGGWNYKPTPYAYNPPGPPETISDPAQLPASGEDRPKPPLNGGSQTTQPVDPYDPDNVVLDRTRNPIRVAGEGYGPVNINDVNSTVSEAHFRSPGDTWSSGNGVIFKTGTVHKGQEILDSIKEPYLNSRRLSLSEVDPNARYYIESISMTPYGVGTDTVGDGLFDIEVKYAYFILQLTPIYEGSL